MKTRRQADRTPGKNTKPGADLCHDRLVETILAFGSPNSVPNKPADLNDLRKRWWFLMQKGAVETKFASDPIAQGYEIISRHPGFADCVCVLALGIAGGTPWTLLSAKQKKGFALEFAAELITLGLSHFVFLDPKRVMFDCRRRRQTIVKAVRDHIAELRKASSEVLKAFPEGEYWRGRTSRDSITMESHVRCSEFVTLDWSPLTEQEKNRSTPWSQENVIAALNTFLGKDPVYRAHRKKCIEFGKMEDRRRLKFLRGTHRDDRKRLATATRRLCRRPTKCDAKAIAFACIALDWSQNFGNQNANIPWKGLEKLLELEHRRRYDHDLRRASSIHELVTLSGFGRPSSS